jgi:2-(1,2-epoxy-1,2-dihydrophenyl)acetyl-CoA isomerase
MEQGQSSTMQHTESQERRAEGIAWRIDARGIGRITLDRGEQHNTVSLPAAKALAQAIDEVANGSPRVVLLTGRGKAFCSGGDIGEFAQNAGALDALVDRILTLLHPAIRRLSELPVPVVTALNGAVGGAGVGLALCGDFAFAAASMKLRTGYVALGLSPDAGSSFFLTRRVGSLRARQLFMTNDTVEAQRCLDLGIVDAVFADDRLMSEAEAMCSRLAESSTHSMAGIKQLCEGAQRRSLVEHLGLEKALLEGCAASAEAREGVGAFIAKKQETKRRRPCT